MTKRNYVQSVSRRSPQSAVLSTGYEKYKVEAQNANARKEQLWDEAMEHGGVGDRNADSKIAKMENRLKVNIASNS